MSERLPDVMVFQFDERLGHSMWVDSPYRRERTLRGLVKALSKEVKEGRIGGYRLMRKELEITGICPSRERDYLESVGCVA